MSKICMKEEVRQLFAIIVFRENYFYITYPLNNVAPKQITLYEWVI